MTTAQATTRLQNTVDSLHDTIKDKLFQLQSQIVRLESVNKNLAKLTDVTVDVPVA